MPENAAAALFLYFLSVAIGFLLGWLRAHRDPRENSDHVQDVADWLEMDLDDGISDADALAKMAGFVEGRNAERGDAPDENTARAVLTVNGVEVLCENISISADPSLTTHVMLTVIPDDERQPMCAAMLVEALEGA